MRCYHKDLIDVLPRNQLLGQWRECCAIASNLANIGTPNHILVNKIMEYTPDHFYTYTMLVYEEFVRRGYKVNPRTINTLKDNLYKAFGKDDFILIDQNELFKGWHSTRYLLQCLCKIEEFYDCGGIKFEDWFKILNKTRSMHTYCEETYQSLFV